MRYLVILFLLGGCANIQAARTAGAEKTADAADQFLAHGIWSVCKAPTAGSLERLYGNDPDGAEAWRNFCTHSAKAVAIGP